MGEVFVEHSNYQFHEPDSCVREIKFIIFNKTKEADGGEFLNGVVKVIFNDEYLNKFNLNNNELDYKIQCKVKPSLSLEEHKEYMFDKTMEMLTNKLVTFNADSELLDKVTKLIYKNKLIFAVD